MTKRQGTIDPVDHMRIRELRFASMLPGSWDKRFVSDLAARIDKGDTSYLTPGQSHQLARLAWKYRRQIACEAAPREEPRK